MKRFIYIGAIALMMGIVSCSKETIRPVAQEVEEVPVWKSAATGSSSDEGDTSEGGDITDPNNDKDENSRRKN